jgi:site-specific DNA-methyltransferase (adenine-specific)
MISEAYLMDCMDYMATIEDQFFDLAIVDPPYGIDINMNMCLQKGKRKHREQKDWDTGVPDAKYFEELMRVSKNQIICGGNYYDLPPCKGFVFWYKHSPFDDFSDGEFLWTSFDRPARCFDYRSYGAIEGKIANKPRSFHPTAKPVYLYKWLLKMYAEPGQKIFDSHLGSQSSRIAAYDMRGFHFWGCEIDEHYYEEGCKRFEDFKRQTKLFS